MINHLDRVYTLPYSPGQQKRVKPVIWSKYEVIDRPFYARRRLKIFPGFWQLI